LQSRRQNFSFAGGRMDGNNGDVQSWKQFYQFADPARRAVPIKPTVNHYQTWFLVADKRIQRVVFLARNRNVFKARRFKTPFYLRMQFHRPGQRQHPAHYSPSPPMLPLRFAVVPAFLLSIQLSISEGLNRTALLNL